MSLSPQATPGCLLCLFFTSLILASGLPEPSAHMAGFGLVGELWDRGSHPRAEESHPAAQGQGPGAPVWFPVQVE